MSISSPHHQILQGDPFLSIDKRPGCLLVVDLSRRR